MFFFSLESSFTALKTENKMGRICKGFLMQTWNKVINLKAYDFQNKSHVRSYNCFRKFFSGIQTASLSELGTKEEELRKMMWLASVQYFLPFIMLVLWLACSQSLGMLQSYCSFSSFSIGIVWVGFAREENNTIRLYQQHYSNRESKAPFNNEFTPTAISEKMLLLQSHAHAKPLNNVCGKREVKLG